MIQVNNRKFVLEADRDRDDIVIYPRDVYYPGQPALYVTHTEAADLRDLLNMVLNVPERKETKTIPAAPVLKEEVDGNDS